MGETAKDVDAGPLESYGVLVGWTHNEMNDRFDLRLQSIKSTRKTAPNEVDSHHFIMTRSQAAVLANYLLTVSGQTAPRPRRRGLLARLRGARQR